MAFVPDRWGGVWQPRQQVLTRLARYFHVLWVEPPIEWRAMWLHGEWKNSRLEVDLSLPDGFEVYRPGKWLPKFFKPRVWAEFLERCRLGEALQRLSDRGCEKFILYLWRPEFAAVLNQVRHDLSCYHIDDEYSFSPTEQPLDYKEADLITRADQVFIHSPALWDKKGRLNSNTTLVPNGVDYLRYATPLTEPEELRRIPRPRMGYVGVVQSTIDWDLLCSVAQNHQHWSFVCVGPRGHLDREDAQAIDKLLQLPNVHFLGGKPVHALPAYTQHLDVCMMPYKLNDYTKFIYPLKLHEYLASGRPAVGTPIRSLQDYQHVLKLARTAGEWSEALSDALAPEAVRPNQVEARRTIARSHDWSLLVERIARTMCDRIGGSLPQQLDAKLESKAPQPAGA